MLMHGGILRQCNGAGRGNSYPVKQEETWYLEVLKTGVNKAPVNKMKRYDLAVGQLLQRAMFGMLYLLQAPVGAW